MGAANAILRLLSVPWGHCSERLPGRLNMRVEMRSYEGGYRYYEGTYWLHQRYSFRVEFVERRLWQDQ